MGNGYFEKMNMGSIDKRSRSAAAAMRRRWRNGGGSSGGEKPKQPQRGLGVAQLEKIRLYGQMGCADPYSRHFFPNLSSGDDMRMQTTSSSFSHFTTQSSQSSGFHQNFMGMEEYERGSFRYEDSQPTTSVRWEPSNTFLETTQHFGQQNMIGHLFNPHVQKVQDSMHKNMNTKYGRNSIGSSSYQNYESSETQELDLELRLSI